VTAAELQAFVAFEARCLDERRWDEWAALFTPDGWYWLPADVRHTDPLAEASHLYDDRLLREVRLRRLSDPQAHSQRPPGAAHHLLQASELLGADEAAGRYELRTPFIYTELRAGRTTARCASRSSASTCCTRPRRCRRSSSTSKEPRRHESKRRAACARQPPVRAP
jgi:3-phenylpropionate/cinnamic acid dioxygenase small subunit